MQLEFAVLCDFAGRLPEGQFVVVGPALHSVAASSPPTTVSASLAASVRLCPEEAGKHTFRVDATGPGKRRFTVASEQPLQVEIRKGAVAPGTLCHLAIPLGAAFDSPGDYLLHLVIDGQDVKTLPLSVSQADPAYGVAVGPSIEESDALREEEISDWLALERATPSAEVLQRISNRFSPPAEWFQEEDLFEPFPRR